MRAPGSQVKKFAWLPEPLTVEDGLLTPTLKLKRRAIAQRYRDVIDGLYAQDLPRKADYYLANATGQTLSAGWALYVTPRNVIPSP